MVKKVTFWWLLFLSALALGQTADWHLFSSANSIMPSNQINGMAIDSQGVKYIAAENGFVTIKDTTVTVYNASNSDFECPHPTSVTIDKTGLIWIATYCQGIVKFDGTNFTVYDQHSSPIPYSTVTSVAVCKNNNKWMGMQLGGVAKFSAAGTWLFYNTSNSVMPSNDIRGVTVNTVTNDKWFATDKGVVRFDGISSWSVYDSSNSDLPSNDFKAILADNDGNIWMGSDGDGLVKFSNGVFTIYNTVNSGLRSNRILSLAKGNPGEIWIGTYSGGVQKFNGTTWSCFNTTNCLLTDNRIDALIIDHLGNKWIGTHSQGLFVYNENGVALPVELVSFTSTANNGGILLQWVSATEMNCSKYIIERSHNASSWQVVAEIKAAGTSTTFRSYSYTDKDINNGSYTYRLKILDYDGTYIYSNETTFKSASPDNYILDKNYPNPFNPSTTISYYLPFESRVTLSVYNSLGEEVKKLVSGIQNQGVHNEVFNAGNIPSGIYIYKINAASSDGKALFNASGKMLLIK